jgi:hypothetical protein
MLIFSKILTASFIDGGNQRSGRKPPTFRKSVKKLDHVKLYWVHLALGEIRTPNFSANSEDEHWLHK